MKSLTKTAVIAVFTFVLSAGASFAQYILTFDENGNGIVNGQPLPSSVQPDPTGGILNSPVLVYFLPFDTQPGDVRLVEPAQPNDASSDLIRFFSPTPGGNSSLLIFYSDTESGEPNDLADVGIPSTTTIYSVLETGPEGNNGAVWTPALPQPGTPLLGGPFPGAAQYNIISDVPEPGAPALLFAGAAALGVQRLIRKRRAFSARAVV